MTEPIALGLDIGGTTTKIGLVSAQGEILTLSRTPTDVEVVGLEPFLCRVFGLVEAMLARAEVVGIGATFCAWIDEARTGPFLPFNAPSLNGLNLKRRLEETFGLPVKVIDDSTAHLMAEYTYGSGRGSRRFMNLAMGTGITAGVVINGRSLDFIGGNMGDTGHLILRPEGPRCSAGCRGCAEALIGVAGIERLAGERFGAPKTVRKVIELARAGDITAVDVIQEVGLYAGELLASLSHMFLPERIAISGGTSAAGDLLLNSAKERFEYLVGDYHREYAANSNGFYNGVEIVLGEIRGETGLIGATLELFRN